MKVYYKTKTKETNEFGLTALNVAGMKALRKAGWTLQEIADHFEVTIEAVKLSMKRG
jgi:predicted DNA-binding protein YlxM (UPF0122 family)